MDENSTLYLQELVSILIKLTAAKEKKHSIMVSSMLLLVVCRVLLGINPAGGSEVSRSHGCNARSGVHGDVLLLVWDLAVFDEVSA
jgi:hypothetical protein